MLGVLALLPLVGAVTTVGSRGAQAATFQDATAYQMNPAHTGISSDPRGPDWTPKWSVTESVATTTPLIADGQVFELVKASSPTLFAYNANTGAQNWAVAVGSNPLGITYQSGRVFEQSGGFNAVMSAYDAGTGQLDWSATIPGQYSFSSAPTAANGIVYTTGAGSGGTLYAFSQTTGALLWTKPVTNGDSSSPAADSNGVYVSFACDLTQAFDATSGSSLWTYQNSCEGGGGQTSVLADGELFLRDQILNASTGKTVRGFAAGPSPAVDGQYTYTEDSGTLRAESVANGSILWSQAGDGGFQTSPIEVDGVIYEGSSTGSLFGYSARTGQQVADIKVGTAIGPSGTGFGDSYWSMAEGEGLLAIPAGDTLTVYGQSGTTAAAPSGVSATPGDGQVAVGWTVPPDNGNPITDFTVTPLVNGVPQTPLVIPAGSSGSATDPAPGASDQATVPWLTNGSTYTFTVAADSSGGQSAASAASNAATPVAGPTPPLPPSAPDDATAYQMNPGHTGIALDSASPQWTASWTKTEPGTVDTPLLAQGEVFAIVQSSPPVLVAFDAATGAQRWAVAPAASAIGITYQAGRLFDLSGGFNAVLSAFDASTGTLDWSATVPGQYMFSSAPTADNGIVYVVGAGGGGTLYAFDQTTGALLWEKGVMNGDDSAPAVDSNGVYVSFACDLTQAFNATSGNSLWSEYYGCEGGGGQTAVLADGDVFLRDKVLSASTGATIRSLSTGPPPAVDGQYIYTEAQGTLRAQTMASGLVLWSNAGDGGFDTAPIVVDGVVYEGSTSGNLYGFSAVTGQQVALMKVGTAITLAMSNNTDSSWSLSEGDNLLAVPAGSTLSIYAQSGDVPSAPTSVTATVNGGQPTVSWIAPNGNGNPITDFTITPSTGGVAQTPVVVPAGATGSATDPTPGATDQFAVPGLTNGESYTFTVAADSAGGQSQASAPSNSVSPYAAPAAPTSVSAVAGQQSAQLSWVVGANNGAPISGFVVNTYQNGTVVGSQSIAAGSPGTSLDPTPGTQDNYDVTGLTDGVGVSFTVKTVNTAGASPGSVPSAVVYPGYQPGLPYAPSTPTAVAAPSPARSATVSWVVPSNNGAAITNFLITPSLNGTVQPSITVPAGSAGSALDPTPGASDSYTVNNLSSGSYTFLVAAENSVGTGSYSPPSNAVTVPGPPGAPSGVNASVPSTNFAANVAWTVPPNNTAPITGYVITPFLAGVGQPSVSVAVGASGTALSPDQGSADSYPLSGLTAGSYTFTVKAVNSYGTGPASAPSPAVTVNGPRITLSLPSVNFGSVSLGDLTVANMTLTNVGNASDTISDVQIRGVDPYDFIDDASQCTTLAPNQSCQVPVGFLPGALGTRVGTLAVVDSEPRSPSTALQGIGTEGYYVATASGAVRAFGDAPWEGDASQVHLTKPVVGIASTGNDAGYWMVASDGGVFSYGDAAYHGGTGNVRLAKPVVGMAATPDDGGYWLVASDGGVFTFGDAPFYGSTGNVRLQKPIIAIVPTTDGGGYWLVASDGGVFTFGDARFFGSTGGRRLNAPVVGMAATPDGGGYWLVASDGGIFSFGDARYYGGLGAVHLSQPITGMAAAPDGHGYWLVASDGGVFNFGSAAFRGSAGGQFTNAVGMAESGYYTLQAALDVPA